jgi:cell division initiation protein
MPFSPVEIRHLQFKRGALGYVRAAVDKALVEVAESFEEVWRQRADLADRVEELEREVNRHVELEQLLRSTLISAERAAHDMREQARREAEVILTEARAEARTVVRDAAGERERITGDVHRIQAMLRTALAVVEQDGHEGRAPGAAAAREGSVRSLGG